MIKKDLSHYTFFRGRVGLYAILKALGIGEGDDVAIQAFTCLAVPEAILAAHATPIYVDIEPLTFNMAPRDLLHKITPRTKAIIVQHTYGIPANMDAIVNIAEKANIPIVEDCCHILYGTFHGKMLGTFGVASFYSYEWGKPLVIGLGGSVKINDQSLREKLEAEHRQLRNPSISTQVKIHLQYFAFKLTYRPRYYWIVKDLFHMLSALGVAKSNYNPINGDLSNEFCLNMAPSLKRRLSRKQNHIGLIAEQSICISDYYRANINSCSIQHPIESADSKIYYARYPLLVEDKESLIMKARSANIEISDWYNTPIHPLREDSWEKVYYQKRSCPNAETTCQQVISLPTHYKVSEKELNDTIEFLNYL